MDCTTFGRRRRGLLLGAMAATAGLGGLPSWLAAQHAAGHHGAGQAKRRQELGISAAAGRDGKIWAVSRETIGDDLVLALRASTDGGLNWSAAQAVQLQEPVAAGGESRPKIAIGSRGQLYIAYTKPVARPHIGDIRFMRSLDGGRSFSEPMTVHANRDVTTHSFESMIVDREGRLFIAWVDGRDADAARARGQAYAGSAIYYAVSDDGGASFRGDYKVADHSCECCRIGLALDPQGAPVALWRHVFAPNVRDHALARLGAGGTATPPARATFDDWKIDACPHHGPSLAYGADGMRHQVWFTGAGEGGGVQYAATAGGARPKPSIVGSDRASHADLAVQGRRIAIVWKEPGADATVIAARLSEDGGKSWRQWEPARTAGDSGKPCLVSAASGVLLAWRTEDEGVRLVRLDRTVKERP